MTDKQKNELIRFIGISLLPLVSPYDQSEQALNRQFDFNPVFNNVVQRIFHLIYDSPLTREKIRNDIIIMSELKML